MIPARTTNGDRTEQLHDNEEIIALTMGAVEKIIWLGKFLICGPRDPVQ